MTSGLYTRNFKLEVGPSLRPHLNDEEEEMLHVRLNQQITAMIFVSALLARYAEAIGKKAVRHGKGWWTKSGEFIAGYYEVTP